MKSRLTITLAILAILFSGAYLHGGKKGKSAKKSKAGKGCKIIVTLEGFKSEKGKAVGLLFNNSDDFPDEEKAWKRTDVKIKGTRAVVVFKGIPKGTYGLSAYHDENDNKELDSNFIGMPKEGVATSNNAKGFMGPPKFKDAKFEVDKPVVKMTIQVKYL